MKDKLLYWIRYVIYFSDQFSICSSSDSCWGVWGCGEAAAISIEVLLYSSLTSNTKGSEIMVDAMIAYGIQYELFAEIKNSNIWFFWNIIFKKKLTKLRNVEKEQKNHSKSVINTSQKSTHNSFRNRIHNFHAKFEKNGAGRISQGTCQNGRNVQLPNRKWDDS